MIDTDAFQIPFIQTVHPFVYLHRVMPAETVELRHVRQLAHRAIRFGGIPTQFALETDFSHNLLGHFADGQLLARPHVDVAVSDIPFARCIRVLEIHVQQYVHAGIRHLFAPKELT